MDIEVAYATPEKQRLIALAVPSGCTLRDAILRSGLLEEFPEIRLEACKMGVYGRLRKPDDTLEPGDRVEIYRPLIADPKQSRRQRAKNKAKPAQ